MIFRLFRWIEKPDFYEVPSDFIKKRFYMFQLKATGETYFAQHINFKHIQLMMRGEGEMTCYFGTMKKSMGGSMDNYLGVAPTVNRRIVCRQMWWPRSERTVSEDKFSLSVPHHYEGDREEFNYLQFRHVRAF